MSEIIAEFIIQARTLREFVETATPIVDEGRIHVNEDGFTMRVLDPATVAMVNPSTLDVDAFESIDAPGSVTLGVNLVTLSDRIKPASPDDLVHLAVDMETRHLKIRYGKVEQSVGMIAPDSIRQEPDTPDLDLPNEVVVTGGDLKDVHTQSEMVSDHVRVAGKPDDAEVKFVAKGDVDSANLTFGNDEVVHADVTEAATSLFSLNYWKDLVKPIPKDAEVTIRFGDEFPMFWEWEAADGHLSVVQMCAPRIETR